MANAAVFASIYLVINFSMPDGQSAQVRVPQKDRHTCEAKAQVARETPGLYPFPVSKAYCEREGKHVTKIM